MPARTLSARKIRNIITLHPLCGPSYRELSRLFDVSSSTVGKYLSAFERSSISLAETRHLSDQALCQLLCPSRPFKRTPRHQTLIQLFPAIHQSLNSHATTLVEQWQSYRKQRPAGYCYSQFVNLYGQWLSANQLPRARWNRWAVALPIEDIKALKEWRASNDKRRWERAVLPVRPAQRAQHGVNCSKDRSVSTDDQKMAPRLSHRGSGQRGAHFEETPQPEAARPHREEGTLGEDHPRITRASRAQQNDVDMALSQKRMS
jgi:hypothetical protein